jgi:hypothetical protein
LGCRLCQESGSHLLDERRQLPVDRVPAVRALAGEETIEIPVA